MLEANGPSFYFSLPYEETLGLQDLCASGKLRPRAANKGTCRLQGFLVKDLMTSLSLDFRAWRHCMWKLHPKRMVRPYCASAYILIAPA